VKVPIPSPKAKPKPKPKKRVVKRKANDFKQAQNSMAGLSDMYASLGV